MDIDHINYWHKFITNEQCKKEAKIKFNIWITADQHDESLCAACSLATFIHVASVVAVVALDLVFLPLKLLLAFCVQKICIRQHYPQIFGVLSKLQHLLLRLRWSKSPGFLEPTFDTRLFFLLLCFRPLDPQHVSPGLNIFSPFAHPKWVCASSLSSPPLWKKYLPMWWTFLSPQRHGGPPLLPLISHHLSIIH